MTQPVKPPVKKGSNASKVKPVKTRFKVWDEVTFVKGDIECLAAVTGIDAAHSKLYLDTPVCAWVDMSACTLVRKA